MDIRKMSYIALFIALSLIGASVKVPAIIGSIALDTFPALLAAVFLGTGAGAMVAGLGHLVSALIGGMPLGPLHLIIAVEMALLVVVFAVLFHRGHKGLAGMTFVIGNALVAPIPFIFLFDVAFYLALLPSLFIGSLFNTVIAWIVIPRFHSIFQRVNRKGEVKG